MEGIFYFNFTTVLNKFDFLRPTSDLNQLAVVKVIEKRTRHPFLLLLVIRIVELFTLFVSLGFIAGIVIDADEIQDGAPIANGFSGAFEIIGSALFVNGGSFVIAI